MRCAHYQETRCRASAEVWLVAPDGEDNPGGHYCCAHAQAIIDEFLSKGGEAWTARPLTPEEDYAL